MSESLPNVRAVFQYLKDMGWKTSQSGTYKHVNEGKLRPSEDGTFSIAVVDRYAKANLNLLSGKHSASVDADSMQRRADAEARKAAAQAEHWELKTKITLGQLVPRESFERELAARAAVFKNDLEGFFRGQAQELIAIVGGDPLKVPDLIEHQLRALESMLGRYYTEKEFRVALSADHNQFDAS